MRRFPALLMCFCWILAAAPTWAEAEAYTYVKFSLGVPWSLYFFFLLLILIPFGLMVLLAWRHVSRPEKKSEGD